LDVARTLLLKSSVPSKFWVEALSTAVYLINRLPSQVLNFDSPYYRLYHQHPSYLNLHTFGCVCFVHLPSYERHKLSAQSVKCAFMGYSISHKGYVCYDPCSNKIRISRNVVFFENQYFFSTHLESLPEISILPCFDELSPLPERFKPGMVYTRHRPTLRLLETDPSSESVQITSPEVDTPSKTVLNLVLDDLPEYHVFLIGMVFPTLLLILLCLLFPFLHAFPRLLNMNVGRKRWMRNFGFSRQSYLGCGSLPQGLMLKSLAVNGFTRLSYALMGLWIGIRHD
jgi:hypothetical protein